MLKRFVRCLGLVLGVFFVSNQALVAQDSRPASQDVVKLQKSFEALVLSRVNDFKAPLASSLKSMGLSLISQTAKQLGTQVAKGALVSVLSGGTSDTLRLTQELVSLTSGLLPSLQSMSSLSVDDIVEKIDDLQDKVVGRLKKLDLKKGSEADKVVKEVLSSIGSLDKALKMLQGDVVAELKGRLKDLKKPLKDAAKDLLQGLAPSVVDRIIEPLKSIQGEIAEGLDDELDALEDVADRLPGQSEKDKTKRFFKGVFKKISEKITESKDKVSEKSKEVVDQLMNEEIVALSSEEKSSPLFGDLSEGAIIAIRSDKQSPGRGRYLSITDDGMLKPIGASRADKDCQFIVARFENYLGLLPLKSIASKTKQYLQCENEKVQFKGADFYSATAEQQHFIPIGNRIDNVYLQNKKTGGFLSVRKEDERWSFGGCVMATDSNGKPATASNWGRFAFEIVRHPGEPVAQGAEVLKDLPDGTLVAIKSLKNPNQPRYLKVVGDGKFQDFVRAEGTSSSDPRCQFYVKRSDNWIGFKSRDWTSLCSDPSTHRVKFIHRTDAFASPVEHWEFHPKSDKGFQGWLQGRSSGGYLTDPQDDATHPWTSGLMWTAFAQVENPLAKIVKGVPEFRMEPAGRGNNGLIEIEIVKKLPKDIGGGGASFDFIPAFHGKNEALFHKNWRFPAGNLELVLKEINAEDNVFINLSPAFGKSTEGLRILLGRDGNTTSSLRQGDDIIFDEKDKEGSVIANRASFWVRLKDGRIAVGKGTEFDKNVIFDIERGLDKTSNLTYLGLGGSIYPVTYGSIKMNNVADEDPGIPAEKVPEKPQEKGPVKETEIEEKADVEEKLPSKKDLPSDEDEQEEVPSLPEKPESTSEKSTKKFVKTVKKTVEKKVKKRRKERKKRRASRKVRKQRKNRRQRQSKKRRQKKQRKQKRRAQEREAMEKSSPMVKTYIQGAEGAHKDADQRARERRMRKARDE